MIPEGVGRLSAEEGELCSHLDDGCFPSGTDDLQARLVGEHAPVRLLRLLSHLPTTATTTTSSHSSPHCTMIGGGDAFAPPPPVVHGRSAPGDPAARSRVLALDPRAQARVHRGEDA